MPVTMIKLDDSEKTLMVRLVFDRYSRDDVRKLLLTVVAHAMDGSKIVIETPDEFQSTDVPPTA